MACLHDSITQSRQHGHARCIRRMALPVKNLARLDDAQRQAIRERAAGIRNGELA